MTSEHFVGAEEAPRPAIANCTPAHALAAPDSYRRSVSPRDDDLVTGACARASRFDCPSCRRHEQRALFASSAATRASSARTEGIFRVNIVAYPGRRHGSAHGQRRAGQRVRTQVTTDNAHSNSRCPRNHLEAARTRLKFITKCNLRARFRDARRLAHRTTAPRREMIADVEIIPHTV